MFGSTTFDDGRHIPPGFMAFGTTNGAPWWQSVTGSPPTRALSSQINPGAIQAYHGCQGAGMFMRCGRKTGQVRS
jgi:hypothetical protein